jgi:DNA-binding SARP family transcriptional activator/DNA-binding XRE family transcriptional regulator
MIQISQRHGHDRGGEGFHVISNRGSELAELVKLHRTARMLTQRQLAAAAGVGLGTLRDLEQGRHTSAHWRTVRRVVLALDIDPGQRAAMLRPGQPTGPVPTTGPVPPTGPGQLARIQILGPLAAWRGSTAVPLGSMRQRAVLGLLALHRGAGLHRDAIIDAVWGGHPPASALTQLHGYVSRLRKLLAGPGGGQPELIARAGPRYRLQAGGGQLDVAAFSQLIGRADRMAGQARADAASSLYEQALALWPGEVLADIDLLRGHPAVAELTRRHSDAVLRYADIAVHTAIPYRALPHLRQQCAREGLNEAAHARLMIALAAAGQQAAALDVFHRMRRRLIGELGIDPGAQLAAAQAHVLRQQVRVGPIQYAAQYGAECAAIANQAAAARAG